MRPFSTMSLALLLLRFATTIASAQHPLRHEVDAVEIRFARNQPVLSYRLQVDSADLSGFDVEIRIRNAPDTFRLAMAAHPEYDDRYWRYLEGPRIAESGATASIARVDSALWRVVSPGGAALVRYRIHLPAQSAPRRSAWIPFLSPTGGLLGGPHSFMYIVGAELAPAHVTLELPSSWDVATGLEPTSDPHSFFAPSVQILVDSPVLAGTLRSWRFAVDGVPHRVVYWPLPGATPFDTVALVTGLEALVHQAVALFGRAPYREYTFMLQDGAIGALEHLNSVSLGAPSVDLARGLTGFFSEAAHEYTHTWNLMRIRPIEYREVDYHTQPPVAGLWWSEGLTMFYADKLLRRARLPTFDSTRAAHIAGLIVRYLASPGNSRFSAERVSRVAYNAPPGALGDYDASTHLQGELLGTMLDLIVRDATDGRRSMDDVMRAMLQRFSGERGFRGRDIERMVNQVCGCNVTPLFDAHVRRAGPINFDRYLRLAGVRTRITSAQVLGPDGGPAPDLRIRAWLPPGEAALRLVIGNPASAWGRAGLHSGDRLASVNGAPVSSVAEIRTILGRLIRGDTVKIEVVRPTGGYRANITVTGYERPSVAIEELSRPTPRQIRRRAEEW